HLFRGQPRQGRGLRGPRAESQGHDPCSEERRRVQVPRHARARSGGPAQRLRRLRRYGEAGQAQAAREGRPYLTGFDADAILAANGGTLAAEVLDEAPEARTFLLPVGGAGLAGGFAFYAKTAGPEARGVGRHAALSPPPPL